MQKSRPQFLYPALKYAALPLLVAIYPAVFHYANNARLVLLSSFIELCLFLAGSGLVIYILLSLFSRGKFSQSAVGALVILVFFQTYGVAFDWLRSADLFQLEIYNFMPVWIFAALYLAWVVIRSNPNISVWICNILIFILGALVAFNLVKVIPVEIEKSRNASPAAAAATNTAVTEQQYPDIYYLIFDEAAGFEVARQYWHSGEVDKFVNFLDENGFYVAEESHGGSIHTLREISTRLNYKPYPVGNEHFGTYNKAIATNAVMDFLKAHGYTIIAYDERRTPYPTMLPVPADVLIEEASEENVSRFTLLDEYKVLVLQSTMLRSLLNQDPELLHHRDMILYTSENIASTQFPSPKFVYAHLMLPHGPFAFSENGTITASSQTEYVNWQRYFENYKFFLTVAQDTVKNILSATEGNAVIIIQSDHGARNFTHRPYTGYLENYPEEYKTWIVNVLHLPGCEDAPLTQDLDPMNTFPIIFNCYFDENFPIK
jgi:hypothetical protein